MRELANKDTITSLELLEQINIFRKEEGRKTELQHKDLLKVIRDEFEEEINERKISPVEYVDKKGEKRPMYSLTLNQAKQVLVRESKYVRKAVILYIEKLENALKNKIKISVDKQKELEIKEINAKTRERNSKIREAKFLESLIKHAQSDIYKQILINESVKALTDKELLPPIEVEKSYTATEIGEILGISANKVGKIANKYNLKNEKKWCVGT